MKTGIISKFSKEELQEIVDISCSYSEVLLKLGLRAAGSNFKTLEFYLEKNSVDTSKLLANRNSNQHFLNLKTRLKKDDLLIANCKHSRNAVIKYLLREQVFEYKCTECDLEDNWNNKKLVLQLDHINGIHNDNRLENLRWICPNCHSQTHTFAGRRLKKIKPPKANRGFNSAPSRQRINWPSKEELTKLIWETPRSVLALDLGVSDVAIAKRCRFLGIDMPPRGYWRKLETKTL